MILDFLRNLAKSDEGKIEFISTIEGLQDICHPYPANSKVPKWVSNSPLVVPNKKSDIPNDKRLSTIRKCSGILDYCLSGYILPLWTDISIQYDSSLGFLACEPSAPWAKIYIHTNDQFKETPVNQITYPYFKVIKLESPWRIKLNKGHSSLFLHPFFSDCSDAFSVIPGIVDHDEFHVANIFVKFELFGRGKVVLKKGTPLCQIFPYKRTKYNASIRFQTQQDIDEENKEQDLLDAFSGKYKTAFWSRKEYK